MKEILNVENTINTSILVLFTLAFECARTFPFTVPKDCQELVMLSNSSWITSEVLSDG